MLYESLECDELEFICSQSNNDYYLTKIDITSNTSVSHKGDLYVEKDIILFWNGSRTVPQGGDLYFSLKQGWVLRCSQSLWNEYPVLQMLSETKVIKQVLESDDEEDLDSEYLEDIF